MHPCAYLLKNVPLLKDFQPIMLEKWQQIWAWINELMLRRCYNNWFVCPSISMDVD
jgi:hypothetical protein